MPLLICSPHHHFWVEDEIQLLLHQLQLDPKEKDPVYRDGLKQIINRLSRNPIAKGNPEVIDALVNTLGDGQSQDELISRKIICLLHKLTFGSRETSTTVLRALADFLKHNRNELNRSLAAIAMVYLQDAVSAEPSALKAEPKVRLMKFLGLGQQSPFRLIVSSKPKLPGWENLRLSLYPALPSLLPTGLELRLLLPSASERRAVSGSDQSCLSLQFEMPKGDPFTVSYRLGSHQVQDSFVA